MGTGGLNIIYPLSHRAGLYIFSGGRFWKTKLGKKLEKAREWHAKHVLSPFKHAEKRLKLFTGLFKLFVLLERGDLNETK